MAVNYCRARSVNDRIERKNDMRGLEATLGIMLGLVALFLVLNNADASNQILSGLSNLGMSTFGTLQGRKVTGGGVTVT
jgi:hypothetical protein